MFLKSANVRTSHLVPAQLTCASTTAFLALALSPTAQLLATALQAEKAKGENCPKINN